VQPKFYYALCSLRSTHGVLVRLCFSSPLVCVGQPPTPASPRGNSRLCSPVLALEAPSSSCSLRHPACHSLTVVFAYVPNIPELLTFRSSISLFAFLYVHTFPHPCTHALHLPARAPSTPPFVVQVPQSPAPCFVMLCVLTRTMEKTNSAVLSGLISVREQKSCDINMKQGQ
jgi:hypothetical protein